MRANLGKTNQKIPIHINAAPAGFHPGDKNIEIWGDRITRKVYFSQRGITLPFSKLPHKYHILLLNQMKADKVAFKEILKEHGSALAGLEDYAFCKYGGLDSSPDLSNDQLAECENFLCKSQIEGVCKCLKWKKITIRSNGNTLTISEIKVLELIGKKFTNIEIAETLHITINTVKTHRANLHLKFGVQSTQELIIDAVNDQIIQPN